MMSNKRPSGPVSAVAALALAALIGGTLWSSRRQPVSVSTNLPVPAASAAPDASPVPDATPSPSPKGTPAPRTEITIYTKVDDEDGSHLEAKTVPATGDSASSNSPKGALTAMAKLPNSPLPKGTVINKALVQSNGLGVVDFNPAFKENFSGGDRGEGMVLNAITQTMAQFGAKQVQITVGGKKIDTLGGMESLDKPLLVSAPNKASDTEP